MGISPEAILQTDGGSRGNPGPSGIGFSLYDDEHILADGGAFIGQETNNIAEYKAMIWGLQNALALQIKNLDIRADSELMIQQVKGVYRVKNAGIKPLYEMVMTLLGKFDSFDIQHVFREANKDADRLVNEALDIRGEVGSFLVPYTVDEAEQLDMLQQFEIIKEDIAEQKCDSLFGDDAPCIDLYGTTKTSGEVSAMYELTVRDHFDAAHALIGYDGPCKHLHGHTWDIDVCIGGSELDSVGIVYDFKQLKTDLKMILSRFDHVYLNEVPPFDTMNATAENLARVIYHELVTTLPANLSVKEVSVWESPIAKLTYRES